MRTSFALAGLVLLAGSWAASAGGDLSNAIGKALFERAWVPAPSSTKANDGLGPLFNARACASCHQGLDRTAPSVDAEGRFVHPGMVAKLSDGAGEADPVYGAQVQTAAVQNFTPEGRLRETAAGLELADLAYGPLAAATRVGLRAAPSLCGIGRLAEAPDAAILMGADPDDRDGDGISGRVNWVVGEGGRPRIGRFGLKASSADLRRQVELGFALDIGMSTPDFPAPEGDCPTSDCRAAPHGGTAADPEVRGDLVAMLTGYLADVPPPPAAAPDAAGAALFASTGCAACHTPSLPSPRGAVGAFTDLLLHDLGPALDGGATERGVAPAEWRTAPLWGISRALRDGAGLLHDGRATGVEEAVALHGGEAAGSRDRMHGLAAADRQRLVDYVRGL
jgi:CxxC motif-containing protein (DUF1111 family)